MDPSAYLTKQGWLGTGHALHPTSGRGLSRPLLVSRRTDSRGVGNKKHNLADQWWSRAFDASLKGLAVSHVSSAHVHVDGDIGVNSSSSIGASAAAKVDTSSSMNAINEEQEQRSVLVVRQKDVTGPLRMAATGGSKWVGRAGLYDFFRRGEGLSGTISHEHAEMVGKISEITASPVEAKAKKERKRTYTALREDREEVHKVRKRRKEKSSASQDDGLDVQERRRRRESACKAVWEKDQEAVRAEEVPELQGATRSESQAGDATPAEAARREARDGRRRRRRERRKARDEKAELPTRKDPA